MARLFVLLKKMGNRDNKDSLRLDALKRIEDPNEFIKILRTWTAEDSPLSEDDIFPLPRDSAGDIIEGFIGAWLVTCAELPVSSSSQVVNSLDYMIDMLREWQGNLQSGDVELNKELLRCLRKATGKILERSYWS